MTTIRPSLLSIAKTVGRLLLGLVAGVLLCHFVAPLRGLRDAVSAGGITDGMQIESFLIHRRIAAASLLGLSVAWLVVMFLAKRVRGIATFTFGIVFSILTTAWLQEICPYQFLMEGRPAKTVFGQGFSREGFQAVQPGMTKDQVAALVGRGLWGGDGPDLSARWFLSGPGTEDHWRYGVEFDASGLVLHKWLEFWWD